MVSYGGQRVTQVCCWPSICMNTGLNHSHHSITTPSMPSLCARTTKEMNRISAQVEFEGATSRGIIVSSGGIRVSHCYPGLCQMLVRGIGKVSQHSHSIITSPSMPSLCAPTTTHSKWQSFQNKSNLRGTLTEEE